MKLKFKPIGLGAGRPIAFISNEFAKEHNIVEGSRIEVLKNRYKIILPANVVDKILKENEISFSDEAIEYLKIKKGGIVNVSLGLQPQSVKYILKKLDGKKLSRKEIFAIITDIVNNALNEAEISYFVSGVYHNGMTRKETIYLIEAVAKTGTILKWDINKIADKHSIGGIPGNRTTPIIVSICAAAGIVIPKTSSRAITSAAGTADVVEVVTNVMLPINKLKKVVKKTNACLAWGGSLGLAPADDKLIRVERLLNLDPESQLLASILAKKISVGSKFVLIDIPCGAGAKVSVMKAHELKKKFFEMGKHFGLETRVVLTEGKQPIGNGIGPVLEIHDVLKVLKQEKNRALDLEKKSVFLAGQLLEMMDKAKKGQGEKLAYEILKSGEAYKKFDEIIKAQGQKKDRPKVGKFVEEVKARRRYKIKRIDNKKINLLARTLGCPSDKGAGIYLYKKVGDNVERSDVIMKLYSLSKKKLNAGIKLFKEINPVKVVKRK